ncbi:hypothetical protein FOG18_05810 [Legionella israelensis]|uniref:Lpg1974 family pore-forming outer membrane protein n=1 Tax=Legionella israelensis TaxID=454 RepID=UPI0011807EB7|nr:Lpg1974 family pore-forming outer membrane protein [Legionella israelensis]QDP72115.1 hypothetical protein FOG18_05810 [Legionella israelensis]
MFSLKTTALVALAIGSSATIAGTVGSVCTSGDVTVPCELSGWDVGVYALYLEPSYNGNPRFFNYRGSNIGDRNINSIGGPQRVHNKLNTNFDWGFKLEGSYHFNTGNDINVNWYHWNDTSSENLHYFSETDGSEVFFTPLQRKHKWDTVNLEFGQHVDFGGFKNIRFHGGFQYARLEHNQNAPHVINIPAAFVINDNGDIERAPAKTLVGTNRIDLTFRGVGPRVGADMSYDWRNGFAIYANGAAALLVGDAKVNDYSDVEPNRASHTAIVPELEVKVGLKYTYAMAQGNLALDGGYMVANYWDAFHLVQAGIAGTSNFGVHGPFLGLKYLAAL